jgi:4-carboxymuconolactone decarboxylase
MAAKAPLDSPREKVRATVPKLIDLTDKVVFGDVWERTELSKRDRSLITVAALVALYRPEQLRLHIARALGNGVTRTEISEIITHMAFYSGWPTAMTAALVAKEVFEQQV